MSPHLTCNGCGITTEENENGCADIESSLQRGWTHARDKSYCPICADVRSQTWPDTEATDGKAESMIPRETHTRGSVNDQSEMTKQDRARVRAEVAAKEAAEQAEADAIARANAPRTLWQRLTAPLFANR